MKYVSHLKAACLLAGLLSHYLSPYTICKRQEASTQVCLLTSFIGGNQMAMSSHNTEFWGLRITGWGWHTRLCNLSTREWGAGGQGIQGHPHSSHLVSARSGWSARPHPTEAGSRTKDTVLPFVPHQHSPKKPNLSPGVISSTVTRTKPFILLPIHAHQMAPLQCHR